MYPLHRNSLVFLEFLEHLLCETSVKKTPSFLSKYWSLMEKEISFLNFIFQLQFIVLLTLYSFQGWHSGHTMCLSNIVVRQPHLLQSGPPDISSTYLAPYVVITILLTIFAGLHVTSGTILWPSIEGLNPFTFLTQPPTPLPSGNRQSVLCVCQSLPTLFILLFRFHIWVKSYGISLCLPYLFHLV